MDQDARKRQPESLDQLSEDLSGFGSAEIRTFRDLLIRPAKALEGWMTLGPTANGLYSRPLRFYFGLCGIMTLILLLKGGATVFESMPDNIVADLAAGAGKSADTFRADADNWYSFVLVPLSCLFYALASVPLLRLWDQDVLGWRKGFRATFAFLNAWTVLVLPVTWWSNEPNMTGLVAAIVFFVAAIFSFLRIGRGRWWRTWPGGIAKGTFLVTVIYIASLLALVPIILLSYLGAMYIG